MMGRRKYRDIEIRGVVYATPAAAAAAIGVQPQTVVCALKNGTLDDCGLGKVHPKPMRIQIRGEVFSDVGAAARHFAVTRSAIYNALQRGTLDRIGQAANPVHTPVPPKPFCIGGLRWPSMSAASQALGFEKNYISRAFSRNSAYAKERILAAAMAYAVREGLT